MRKGVENWLNQVWYGDLQAPAWLRALSPLYRGLYLIHRHLQRARQPLVLQGKAIVVVGNITAGGSGKTPLVLRLCRLAQQAGLKPGIVSRGYGSQVRERTLVSPDDSAQLVGDEPLLLARRSGVPVVIGADRCASAQWLFERAVDLVISDDGLQHHRLPRSIEICVVDGVRAFGNGHLLPAGPLREPVKRLQHVDYVVVNGGEADSLAPRDRLSGVGATGDQDGQAGSQRRASEQAGVDLGKAIAMQLVPGILHSLQGDLTWRLPQFAGCKVNAVAGIGNPERFFNVLQQANLQVNRHPFPDHHTFTREDFATLPPGLPIIMTEKDAVKCTDMNLKNAWYLAVNAQLPAAWEHELIERVRNQVHGWKSAGRNGAGA